MESLKSENQALMEELVLTKMALAELSELHAKLKRDFLRQAHRDKVPTTDPYTSILLTRIARI